VTRECERRGEEARREAQQIVARRIGEIETAAPSLELIPRSLSGPWSARTWASAVGACEPRLARSVAGRRAGSSGCEPP